ncbi:MAG: hypothetical protein AB1295_04360 [Candidatus Micrarchaeota archaeon]
MKKIRKPEDPRRQGCREPARKKFGRWLAAPVIAGGMLLAGCMASVGNDNRNTAAHETGPSNPECVTRPSQRELPDSMQYVETTYCKGELSAEVSTFDPPLDKIFKRAQVKLLDSEPILLYFDQDVVVIAEETENAALRAGELFDVTGYHVHNGVPVNELDHVVEVLSISGGTVQIAIKDTLYAQGGLFGPDELSAEHYGWYAFNVLPGEWIYLKFYGFSNVEQDNPSAELGVISQPAVLFQRQRLEESGLVFRAERQGDRLVGWTLSTE